MLETKSAVTEKRRDEIVGGTQNSDFCRKVIVQGAILTSDLDLVTQDVRKVQSRKAVPRAVHWFVRGVFWF